MIGVTKPWIPQAPSRLPANPACMAFYGRRRPEIRPSKREVEFPANSGGVCRKHLFSLSLEPAYSGLLALSFSNTLFRPCPD